MKSVLFQGCNLNFNFRDNCSTSLVTSGDITLDTPTSPTGATMDTPTSPTSTTSNVSYSKHKSMSMSSVNSTLSKHSGTKRVKGNMKHTVSMESTEDKPRPSSGVPCIDGATGKADSVIGQISRSNSCDSIEYVDAKTSGPTQSKEDDC